MAKRAKGKQESLGFPFYEYLLLFHKQERKRIYATYTTLTRKFLRYNDPGAGICYLRPPQFEALEVYVFLKEFCGNRYLYEVFEDWYRREGVFEGRATTGLTQSGQTTLFGPSEVTGEDTAAFERVFEEIKSFQQVYPNYIFALTMGLGKTVLMATSIFYEFLLANKYPQDPRYCHNALVFAPDKTVLQSLREIETLDKGKVVPPEYASWLETNLKFHFLDDSGVSLNAIDGSAYNVIISNTQKIILKKQHKGKTPSQLLFEDYATTVKAKSLNKGYEDLYGFEVDTEADLVTNQRFAKLTRLRQLGIYVDEAHHVFGNTLAKDFGLEKSATSLRVTINELAEHLREAGTAVVGCYNYTGTPYVGKRLLPEVVYAYGLRNAIDNRYLKRVKILEFANVKSQTRAFVRTAIEEFLRHYSGVRYEGMLPKLAFFASTVEELEQELRPAVEDVLAACGRPHTQVLVNVGDPKVTSNDDLREFRNLDTVSSEKQFILLVNKGKEGWNCRSLFGVALHRVPKSKVFVLQATMRCLRAIGPNQEVARVWLAQENVAILEKELEENFHINIDDLGGGADADERITVIARPLPPAVTVTLRRPTKLHTLKERVVGPGIDLELEKADTEKYAITVRERSITDLSKSLGPERDVSHIKEQRAWSELTLVAEIGRYLNLPVLRVRNVLRDSKDGMERLVERVNAYNELLYDWVIPRLFSALFELKEYASAEEEKVSLLKHGPRDGMEDDGMEDDGIGFSYGASYGGAEVEGKDYFRLVAKPELVADVDASPWQQYRHKSFHLSSYCFDSKPEMDLFEKLLKDPEVRKVYFTGMLTHGQSEFFVSYVDPETHTVRSYYPDFYVVMVDDRKVIYEVKRDDQVDDVVVAAKAAYARELAGASGMEYVMVRASEV